ncbi:hypothetical protein RN607_00755 [Demequina capsici]|uniref:Uncharacterized protein n=1 Tax=Demequina capsici TaxID=3075620 RepID=A0AA96FCX9_9MICO|nr:hypothetical protein [Demequina sp. PMTSA13]WNM27563.1 hypothetical protein RN607_00755 [Demequina sp. PMTSA13]
MLATLTAWFTATRRQKIYAAVAALVPLLVWTGTLVAGQADHILTLTTIVLQAGAGILQIAHYTPAQAASWFITTGRLILYSTAGLAMPALVGLGLFTAAAGDTILQGLSMGLTALAAVVAVITLTPDSPAPTAAT